MKNTLELLFASIAAALLALSALWFYRARNSSSKQACLGNLVMIYNVLDQRIQEGAPPLTKSNAFTELAAYCSFRYLICPQDRRHPAQTPLAFGSSNVSYFLGCDRPVVPSLLVAGDRNITNLPGVLRVTSTSSLVWHPELGLHGNRGHLLLGDGWAGLATGPQLAKTVMHTTGTNTLIVP